MTDCLIGFFGVNCEQTDVSTSLSPQTTTEIRQPCFADSDSCQGHYSCVSGQVHCNAGWTGYSCVDADSNIVTPEHNCPTAGACNHGGTCFRDKCCCPQGYTGVLCETKVIPCLNRPCQNGGTCLVKGLNYTCLCLPGKFGGILVKITAPFIISVFGRKHRLNTLFQYCGTNSHERH